MNLRSRVLSDPREFLDRAGPLLEDEARNNLILGIARGMLPDPARHENVGLFVIEENRLPVAAAMITPPFHLLVSEIEDSRAVRDLAQAVHDDRGSIPGVTGERRTVEAFNRIWANLTGATASLEMAQGIFSLEAVRNLPAAAGSFRRATMDDLNLVVEWMRAFASEVLPGGKEESYRLEMITRRRLVGVGEAGFWLWEVDGTPVAISGQSGPTGSGIRINGVYTPPVMRRNGYASALVARQSQWLLDSGYRFCFLFTDLANPTSNAIYRQIGYHQVAESAMYSFS